jgi:PAS domain S-box-containing protein
MKKALEESGETVRLLREELDRTNKGVMALTVELEQQGELFKTLFESVTEGIIIFDGNGALMSANPAAAAVLGLTDRAKKTDLTFLQVFAEPAEGSALFLQLERAGSITNRETTLRKGDGGSIHALANITALRDENGRLRRINFMFVDIREMKNEEEKRLKKLASFPELDPHPVMELDLAGNITDLNPAAKRLFPDLMDKGIKHGYLAGWETISGYFKNGPGFALAREIPLNDSWYSQAIEYVPAMNSVRIYGSDITERKKADEENALKARLLDAATDSIVLCNFDGEKQTSAAYANEAAYRSRGYTREEFLKLSINDYITRESVNDYDARFRQIVEEGTGIFEVVHRRKDGSTMPVEVHSNLIIINNRSYVLSVMRDITTRKKAEDALRASEEKFRTLFENAPVGIIINTFDGRAIERNRASMEMHGYTNMKEFNRIPVQDQYADRADRNRFIAALSEKGVVRNFETRHKRQDGSVFWISFTAVPQTGERGEKQIVIISQDITERKKAEEELSRHRERLEELVKERTSELEKVNNDLKQEIANHEEDEKALRLSEEKYRTLVENLPVCITVTSAAGVILERNRTGIEMFGYDSLEENKVSPAEKTYCSIEDRSRLWGLIEKGPVKNYEVRRRRKDGSVFWASTTVVPYPIDPEKRHITVIEDITERKQAEEEKARQTRELEMANVELSAVNKELESFSSSVSHDLRAPLRSIDGFSQILLEEFGDKFDAEGRDCLTRVRQASQRMGMLIDDLLGLSRVTRSEMHSQEVDLSAMAFSITGALLKSQPDRQVDVFIMKGLKTKGDAHLLNIMLTNLLGNAWKYTGKHPRAKIEFGKTFRDGEAIFFIRDDGAGFDMAYAGKLFQPFQRLHRIDEFEGTGIGLATVQRIINRHGGRIWAQGAVEKGATFYFQLNKEPGNSSGLKENAQDAGGQNDTSGRR